MVEMVIAGASLLALWAVISLIVYYDAKKFETNALAWGLGTFLGIFSLVVGLVLLVVYAVKRRNFKKKPITGTGK